MAPSGSEPSRRAGAFVRARSLLRHLLRWPRQVFIAYRYSPERAEKFLAELDLGERKDDSPVVRLLSEEAAQAHCREFALPVGIFAPDGDLIALTWAEDLPGQFDPRMAEALVVGALVGFDRFASMVNGSPDADTIERLLQKARERYERVKAEEERPLQGE